MIRPHCYSSWLLLTRHFFSAFFRLSFLDDAGEESFKRAIAGILAGIAAFGLLLARVYAAKYRMLAQEPTGHLYESMLPADQLLIICLAMWAVTFVMALVCHSIFPDETDYRILMALPLQRPVVFAAKMSALAGFAGIFTLAAAIGPGIPFAFVSSGRWAADGLAVRAATQIVAGGAASAFAIAIVVATNGLIIVFTPKAWLRTVSITAQTAFICGLVLALPVIARVPAMWPVLEARPSFLLLCPPAWFLGLQQWLLGSDDPYFATLTEAGALAGAIVATVGAVCYIAIYRNFDQAAFSPSRGKRPRRWNVRLSMPFERPPEYRAVQGFVGATLRRSALHQLVFVSAFVAGCALAADRIGGAMHLRDRWLILATLGSPLTLIVAAVLGLRAALLLPANLRAAWVFQITEQTDTRRHCLAAVRDVVLGAGVLLPAALAFPVHAGVLGIRTAGACFPVVLLLGAVFVESALTDWRRIPFTCTVLFGKRPAAFTLVVLALSFGAFVLIGTALLQGASAGTTPWLVIVSMLAMVVAALRWRHRHTSATLPFEFTDYLPDALTPVDLR